MKEELQTKLVEILSSIQAAAGKTTDFAMEQLPDIAQSYVAYGRVVLTLEIVICIAILIGLGWLLRWTYRKVKENVLEDVFIVFAGLATIFAGTVALVTIFNLVPQAVLVWVAPKVWLLKELATLIK